MGETKIFEILDEAKELSEKMKDYKGVADQELMLIWMDNTLKLVMKLGKATEELEDRFELLEDSLEK
ncbi:MAG: hypothetical protein FJ150_08005 [Euryarchaeota archaeon]|nr:hypothetical protein [Euryarchaeota archaeon]